VLVFPPFLLMFERAIGTLSIFFPPDIFPIAFFSFVSFFLLFCCQFLLRFPFPSEALFKRPLYCRLRCSLFFREISFRQRALPRRCFFHQSPFLCVSTFFFCLRHSYGLTNKIPLEKTFSVLAPPLESPLAILPGISGNLSPSLEPLFHGC